MSGVIIKNGVSTYKKFHINVCRMYLRVSTISDDIATADGTGIWQEIMNCIRVGYHTSRWKWPNQPEPMEMQKHDWKEALTKIFVMQGSTKLLYLKQRLGKDNGIQNHPCSGLTCYIYQTKQNSLDFLTGNEDVANLSSKATTQLSSRDKGEQEQMGSSLDRCSDGGVVNCDSQMDCLEINF